MKLPGERTMGPALRDGEYKAEQGRGPLDRSVLVELEERHLVRERGQELQLPSTYSMQSVVRKAIE